MITKIEKITIYVNSQEEARKFWVEDMDFEVTFEQAIGPGMVWIEVSPKGAETALVLYSKSLMEKQNPQMVSHPSVIFSSDNIEELHSRLSTRNVPVDPIEKQPWGKIFSFKDPDGNRYMVRG